MTKEELRDYYKIIERNKVNDDIEVIDLYNAERSNNRHVRLLFAYNKLYYTGDMGTYVFGNHVFNIRKFFRGSEIQPGYWSEKVEASREGVLDKDIDYDTVLDVITQELNRNDKYFLDSQHEEYTSEVICAMNDILDDYDWNPNEHFVYKKIKDFMEEIDHESSDEKAGYILSKCQRYTNYYLYACRLIQWVENEILEEN